MDKQYMLEGSSSTYSNVSMPGTNHGNDSQFPTPPPPAHQPRETPLNYATGKKIFGLLGICLVIQILRNSLFDVGVLHGTNAVKLAKDKVYLEDASVRYRRFRMWCAIPDTITLLFGLITLVLLKRCNQTTIVVLWSIFCVLSLEPLGYDMYNAWDSVGDHKFGKFIWFYILLVLWRVGVLGISLVFLWHLVDIVRKNRIAGEGGVQP